ncbi:MAG: integration host factor subunit alpha [Pseudomonadota bacterium]
MKKQDIIEKVHEQLGFSKRQTTQLVEEAFTIIKDALRRGEQVKISSFGKFSVRHKLASQGRVPKTGVSVTIPAHKVVTFKISRILRDALNRNSYT